jgi:hypothetical protein
MELMKYKMLTYHWSIIIGPSRFMRSGRDEARQKDVPWSALASIAAGGDGWREEK